MSNKDNVFITVNEEISSIIQHVNVNIFLYKKWKIIMYNN